MDYENAVHRHHNHRCPWVEHQAHADLPKEGNILPAAVPDLPLLERRRNHSKWTFLGIWNFYLGRWEAGRRVEIDLTNSLTFPWAIPTEIARVDSEYNYLVCLEVKEFFCPELPYMSAPPIVTKNAYSLLHFCLRCHYLWVMKKNCICFLVWLFVLKSLPEQF